MAQVLAWIAANWRTIATLIGLAVMGYVAYQTAQAVGGAVVQAQPALTQAIQLASYAIPLMVYMMTFQMMFQTISMIREALK